MVKNVNDVVQVGEHEVKSGIVKEEPDEISTEQADHEPIEHGLESFGEPPEDEIKYVKGTPVIRSGNYFIRTDYRIIANAPT